MAMRGLNVFIADLRNCRARELEEKRIQKELANIRSKFRDAGLNGYQKKKYVAKLLYMYILGWQVDFGHLEAVNLIASNKYSEKQIGYLAVTLLLTENSDLLRLVVNSIRKDLEDNNEISNCLALHAIANIAGRDMAESLSNDVQRILVSPASNAFVKKKAALCLLRLFRKFPDIFPATEWAQKIVARMEDPDMGVALSSTNLVLALAEVYPDAYSGSISRAIRCLHKILIERDCPLDYVYYKVPNPWLQVVLLKLLQLYPPPEELGLRDRLNTILRAIVDTSQDIPKNVQHNNAQNAVLFEAMNLAIRVDPYSNIVVQCASLLGRFILSKETNMRYLTLEAMAHFAAYPESLDVMKRHQEIIIRSLRDKDISVRRRALDLLFSICDSSNARTVVGELLQYLTVSDFAIREEMVIKIAILTEKFATDLSWYVDVILQLISIAGDHVSDEVWNRVIMVVSDNESLQQYAAKTVVSTLQSPTCHETVVKVGGYILGEYGHLIADQLGCAPIAQFNSLHSKFKMCAAPTRAMLLSTYLKFVNVFPELKDEIVAVFRQYQYVLDVELQQRAFEYLQLVSMSDESLLQKVCEEMPPWPQRESGLLSILQSKGSPTKVDRAITFSPASATNSTKVDRRRMSNAKSVADGPNLLELDDVTMSEDQIKQNYLRLISEANGILYEDSLIQVGMKSEYQNQLGRIAIFYGNKSMATITDFSSDIASSGAFKVNVAHKIASSISPSAQVIQIFNIEAYSVPSEPPTLTFSFQAGSLSRDIQLRLPAVLPKFTAPVELSSVEFFSRWRQLGGPPREVQVLSDGAASAERVRQCITSLRLSLLEGIDPTPTNSVGAGILSTVELGKVGILMRVELLEGSQARATIKSTNEAVSTAVGTFWKELLASAL
ncbi:Adaptor protein complex AP-2 alpha subunit [Cladochytrium replicatum]|nr:Adaptor protein complex AP-2 alpha subunit [Cladochytrium replicatum]